MKFETQIWTLIGAIIGAIIGFFFNYIYMIIIENRKYNKIKKQLPEQVKAIMRLNDMERAKYFLVNRLIDFKELDQVDILSDISKESALNKFSNPVTDFILKYFREDLCILYELSINDNADYDLKYKTEMIKINKIHGILWEILADIIEYQESKKYSEEIFELLSILYKYSLKMRYTSTINDGINLCGDMVKEKLTKNTAIHTLKILKKELPNSVFKIDIINNYLSKIEQILAT